MLINDGDTRSRNLYRKLVQKTCTTNVHENLTQDHHSFLHKNNGQPITLHGSCHMLHSFRRGIELSSYAWSACKKLVPEKNLYKIDRHTCKFLVHDDLHEFRALQRRSILMKIIYLYMPIYNCASKQLAWWNWNCRLIEERLCVIQLSAVNNLPAKSNCELTSCLPSYVC